MIISILCIYATLACETVDLICPLSGQIERVSGDDKCVSQGVTDAQIKPKEGSLSMDGAFCCMIPRVFEYQNRVNLMLWNDLDNIDKFVTPQNVRYCIKILKSTNPNYGMKIGNIIIPRKQKMIVFGSDFVDEDKSLSKWLSIRFGNYIIKKFTNFESSISPLIDDIIFMSHGLMDERGNTIVSDGKIDTSLSISLFQVAMKYKKHRIISLNCNQMMSKIKIRGDFRMGFYKIEVGETLVMKRHEFVEFDITKIKPLHISNLIQNVQGLSFVNSESLKMLELISRGSDPISLTQALMEFSTHRPCVPRIKTYEIVLYSLRRPQKFCENVSN
jgi:hypothetical protein